MELDLPSIHCQEPLFYPLSLVPSLITHPPLRHIHVNHAQIVSFSDEGGTTEDFYKVLASSFTLPHETSPSPPLADWPMERCHSSSC
jgi:hypothetical protein